MQISPFLSNESNKQYLNIGFAASKEFMESNPEGDEIMYGPKDLTYNVKSCLYSMFF